jgi:hypothetical protein
MLSFVAPHFKMRRERVPDWSGASDISSVCYGASASVQAVFTVALFFSPVCYQGAYDYEDYADHQHYQRVV